MLRYVRLARNVLSVLISPLLRMLQYYKNRKRWHSQCSFCYSSRISENSSFEGCNGIGENTFFEGSMKYGTYISSDCEIIANIGRFCAIAPEVVTPLGIHPIHAPYVSVHPMFFSLRRQNGTTWANKQCFNEWTTAVEIGNDCWIGQRAVICGGIKINDGAIVYAGAVVTKDVPPYAIVGGVPAKILGYRYDSETIEFMLIHKWWDKSLDWIKTHWEEFNNIDKFKQCIIDE